MQTKPLLSKSKTQMAETGKSSSSTSSTTSMQEKALSGVGNLIKLLPTGTVFLFQFLNPVLTNGGSCATINKYFTSVLIGVCGLSCFFSSFTDSYKGTDGSTHYGIVTPKGLWPGTDAGSVNLSTYKLGVGDFVHATFALVIFAVISLLDSNTVECFYPSFESDQKFLLQVLPPIIGAVGGTVFVVFPNKRHGIGYPSSSTNA